MLKDLPRLQTEKRGPNEALRIRLANGERFPAIRRCRRFILNLFVLQALALFFRINRKAFICGDSSRVGIPIRYFFIVP